MIYLDNFSPNNLQNFLTNQTKIKCDIETCVAENIVSISDNWQITSNFFDSIIIGNVKELFK
jgi:hypothetical protein